MDIQQSIISWAKAHEEEFYQDLAALVAIDSAKGEALPGMPYGKGCALVLENGGGDPEQGGLFRRQPRQLRPDLGPERPETELGILAHLTSSHGDGWSFPPLRCGRTRKRS